MQQATASAWTLLSAPHMLRNGLAILLVSTLSALTASAQSRSPSAEFRTAGAFYGNYFQVPDSGVRKDVWGAVTEIGFEDPVADSDRTRSYARIELLQLREIGTSPAVLFGVKRRGRTHRFDVYATMQWNRPRSDVGDELERADQLGGGAEYTLRVAGFQMTGEGEYREEFLKPQRVTTSRTYEAGGSFGYRAFRGRVVPEVGLLRGRRMTGIARTEYVRDTSYVGLRMTAVPRLSIGVRYRRRLRDYTIQDVNSKNFGREDRRDQIRASVDIATDGPLIWNCFGAVEEGRSTRPGRAFVAKSFGMGFTLRY